MTMAHVIKINGIVHEIKSAHEAKLLLNEGKRFAIAHLKSKKLVHKHVLHGRFMSIRMK